MKAVISIFCLPQEISELERIVLQLKDSSMYLSGDVKWSLDVTMTVTDDLVNWDESQLPKSFFEEKFLQISNLVDWCPKTFRVSDEIKGCVSQRRFTLEEYFDSDFFIWLDTDIIFDSRTLVYFENSIQSLSQSHSHYILTPEIVRIWDTTWDCLVNEKFMDKPLKYQETNDPFEDSGIHGEVGIESMSNNSAGQPRFKFAGGWFTGISGDLLRDITVPESFGHYGLEDTFIMHASEKLIRQGTQVKQFKLKNVVVCENYKYRDNTPYTNHMKTIDRRSEYLERANRNFRKELDLV